MRRTIGIISALALVLTGTIAVAQVGSGGSDPSAECSEADKTTGAFGKCVSEKASAFGRCVAAASERGVEEPDAACAHLKPGPESENGLENGQGPGGNGNGNGEGADRNPTTGIEKPPAADGREFGRQVSERARQLGPPEGVPQGPADGVPQGPPEGVPQGPPEGVPQGPPEGTPQGPPAGVPQGPPEGTPQGPAAGVPQGPPAGRPNAD